MPRPGSPARFIVVLAALVWLSGGAASTAPMIPLDNAAADVVCDSSTGHCYEYIQQAADWHTAKAAAELRSHNGVNGHLVTITSAAESAFIIANLSQAVQNNAWIGAYHFGNDTLIDGWEWVTGEPWDYTNWASVAPNDWSERAGLFWLGNGTWNDGHETHPWSGGYLVEYSKPLGSDLVIGKAGEYGHKGNMAMLFGDGTGGFTMNKIELNEYEQGHEVAVGDVNKDGQDDVVVVYSKGQVWVALGGFSDGLQNSDLVSAGSFTDNLNPFEGHNRTRVLQLGDVNNDGKLDIAVTLWAHMAVKLGNGDGTFGAEILTPATGVDARGMALGDLDGDQKVDLVANHAPGAWWLAFHKGNGNGTFQQGIVIPNSASAIPNLFIRDADGDGDMDISTGGLGARAKIFKNDGFANFTKTDLDPGTGMQGTLLVVDDLNGDGTSDVVAGAEANNHTNVRVWLSNGSGGFDPADYGPVGSQPKHGAVADINRDGIKDIAMVTTAIYGGNPGSLWTMVGNGDGTFQAPTQPIATYRNNYTIAAGNFGGAAPTGPTSCPVGSYLSGNTCTLAPAGSYSAGGTATSATLCPIGTYSSDPGAEACTPAAAGTYVSSTGATSPTSCAPGSYSDAEGATACTAAPAGFYVPTPGATSATACTVGYYSNTTGSTLCTPAPAGWYVPTTGATSATACPAGTYSDSAGASECTPAPAGSFVPNAGATSATACPTHYSSEAGATSCFPLDTDDDGVLDKDDEYINSNLSADVSVGACNAGVQNKVLPSGASFNDLLASVVQGAANHGAHVSLVSALSNGWKGLGLISGRDHGAIVSCVAKSK